MSDIRFISDLHLGHKKIQQISPGLRGPVDEDPRTHSKWLVEQWNSVVGKRDHVYVLGDVCFDKHHLFYLDCMQGIKTLVLGNHDKFQLSMYQAHFHSIKGLIRRSGFWISHAPIHPRHLRGLKNIHGHTHGDYVKNAIGVKDDRYINVCVEALDGKPRLFNEIKEKK